MRIVHGRAFDFRRYPRTDRAAGRKVFALPHAPARRRDRQTRPLADNFVYRTAYSTLEIKNPTKTETKSGANNDVRKYISPYKNAVSPFTANILSRER